jgi:hypothetical protein
VVFVVASVPVRLLAYGFSWNVRARRRLASY